MDSIFKWITSQCAHSIDFFFSFWDSVHSCWLSHPFLNFCVHETIQRVLFGSGFFSSTYTFEIHRAPSPTIVFFFFSFLLLSSIPLGSSNKLFPFQFVNFQSMFVLLSKCSFSKCLLLLYWRKIYSNIQII